jgi:hypothetical protein
MAETGSYHIATKIEAKCPFAGHVTRAPAGSAPSWLGRRPPRAERPREPLVEGLPPGTSRRRVMSPMGLAMVCRPSVDWCGYWQRTEQRAIS